jgi:Holliday junction resolvase RusA-like endonuclease
MNYRSQGGITYFQPVAITYDFWLKDNRKIDLDNLIKGVNDALNGLAWPDDSVKYIRYYEGARIVIDTSRVREQAIIRIRPAVKFIEEYKANNVLSL